MQFQIGICDDNSEDIKILTEALCAYDASFKISTYTDGESLLEDISENKILFDILFLDIYMPRLNGVETAIKIRSFLQHAKIIFISSSNDHYPEAYDVFAFNYVLKPLDRTKLNGILDQAFLGIANERRHQISFSYKSVNYRIFSINIMYIESRNKIIYFHMKDKTLLNCYGKLDEILKQLPEESFIRCHQSYVVNASFVTEMVGDYFFIGSVGIGISKRHRKNSKDKYFDYLFNHISKGM
ncbi:MAG: LytR/AlgR family response regulator transcription factor [Sedimentibacter sp.]